MRKHVFFFFLLIDQIVYIVGVFFIKMPTNFDNFPKLATRGQQVRIRIFGGAEPDSWKNIGIVTGIQLDTQLTEMNHNKIQIYRILVDFGDEDTASVLPYILKLV